MKHDHAKQFDMNLLPGKIVMAFTDPLDCFIDNYAGEDRYKYFTDDFTGEGVHTYYVFDTPEEFINKWQEICEQPNGMWYWCVYDGECFCSGACDPDDIDIFENYFNRHPESPTELTTVEELIKRLEELPPKAKVYANGTTGYLHVMEDDEEPVISFDDSEELYC